MEEKKTVKISLSAFLLILAIVLIIVLAFYIYVEKTNANKEIETLEKNAKEMQSTINNLQGKINSISNTINNDSTVEDKKSQTNNISSNKEIKFSDGEIKKALQNYLNLMGAKEGSPSEMLQQLGLYNFEDYNNANIIEGNYIKTDIKYSEFKGKMLNYVTEEWFNTKFKDGYKEKDGMLCYFNGGATGMVFEVKDITLKGDYSSKVYIAQVYNINIDDSKELNNLEFHIEDNNGKCVISYCD